MEEHATMLLMRKCGTLERDKTVTPADHSNFREQFMGPLEKKVVTGFRETLSLIENAAEDPLGALALQGET